MAVHMAYPGRKRLGFIFFVPLSVAARPTAASRPLTRAPLNPRRYLHNNQLSSLAAGVFDKLTALRVLCVLLWLRAAAVAACVACVRVCVGGCD